MTPNSIFVDVSRMYLKAIILQIFRENIQSWFGLATNYKRKCVIKSILVNLGTQIFKNFSPVQTFLLPQHLPPEEVIFQIAYCPLPFSSSSTPAPHPTAFLKVGSAVLQLD